MRKREAALLGLLVLCALLAPTLLELARIASRVCAFRRRHYTRRAVEILTLETRRDLRVLHAHDRSLRDYAARHGYVYASTGAFDPPGPVLTVYMRKLQFMLAALERSTAEFVMWMDSDTMVSHPSVALEEALELAPAACVYIGIDIKASLADLIGMYTYNAGVFILRRCEVSRAFLRDCIAQYMANPACVKDGTYVSSGPWAGECYEQGVMNAQLRGAYRDVVCQLPVAFAASSWLVLPGAVIMHAHGTHKPHREYEQRLAELGVA
jgi:hypothetical protein